MQKIKRIPYGEDSFDKINAENEYYVDKTSYIHNIEATKYVFLIRPRRFGKSMFLSMLQCYYDCLYTNKFEQYFKNTWILDNPTEEKNKYMIMSFDFSGLSCKSNEIEKSFKNYCNNVIDGFLQGYNEYINNELIEQVKNEKHPHEKLATLDIGLRLQEDHKQIYIMIDEYDNFANTILSEERVNDYQNLMHASGIFKSFFATLKKCSGKQNSSIARMFITGVSPITMDDVTSGMNIGDFVSSNLDINEAFGFTLKDIHKILDYYIEVGKFKAEDKE